ncbi:MAG: hypothetical protein IKS52_04700 [Clostridia bacterium]|nr:hypothetical protein [Clostridia bacterium]
MKPDLDRAAVKAAETLIKHRVSFAPVDPLPILKSTPGALAMSFAELAARTGSERDALAHMFGGPIQDAVTVCMDVGGRMRYIVAYNQRISWCLLQRALARELGHIVLGHDGSRPDDVRAAEAQAFAYHLLCPRPIIRAALASPVRVSLEVLGSMTGCYSKCLAGMRELPGARVPAELNRLIRDQFADYMASFLEIQALLSPSDSSETADFGSYMDNYEE